MTNSNLKIGVLALQGAVSEHIRSLERAGAESCAVKTVGQLEGLDGLVIPGGESTVIGKLMRKYGFVERIREFSAAGRPIFGTCAGLIVLATSIEGQEEPHLGLMNMTVARNAFGRQRESFETDLPIEGIDEPVRAVFIRAPLIREIGADVEVLAVYNGEMVTAREGHLLVSSFHPELTDDYRLHAYFADMVRQSRTGEPKG